MTWHFHSLAVILHLLCCGVAAAQVCEPQWLDTPGAGASPDDDTLAALVSEKAGVSVLFVGGKFTHMGSQPLGHIGRWDGTSWSDLGGGVVGSRVRALEQFDDGGGPALHVGGSFSSAGGVAAASIARWDGAAWSALGGGLQGAGGGTASVFAMKVHDDGTGPALYVGGDVSVVGVPTAVGVVRWDGVGWSDVAGLIQPSGVAAMEVFDDGGGPQLYVAGQITLSTGASIDGVARWDGAVWSPVAQNLTSASIAGPQTASALCLEVFDHGLGPALFIGGSFDAIGGVSYPRIARWDGAQLTNIGGVYPSSPPALNSAVVHDLEAVDLGNGPALFAGGQFPWPANGLARFDGSGWEGIEVAPSSAEVYALAGGNSAASGPALFLGGDFTTAGGDSNLAAWGCADLSEIPGCAANPASLTGLTPSAPIGGLLSLRVQGAAASSGACSIFLGSAGFDSAGCGLVLPFGELLLSITPAPLFIGQGAMTTGSCDLALPIPPDPSLVGTTLHLQAAAVDLALVQPVEMTNGLAVRFDP